MKIEKSKEENRDIQSFTFSPLCHNCKTNVFEKFWLHHLLDKCPKVYWFFGRLPLLQLSSAPQYKPLDDCLSIRNTYEIWIYFLHTCPYLKNEHHKHNDKWFPNIWVSTSYKYTLHCFLIFFAAQISFFYSVSKIRNANFSKWSNRSLKV